MAPLLCCPGSPRQTDERAGGDDLDDETSDAALPDLRSTPYLARRLLRVPLEVRPTLMAHIEVSVQPPDLAAAAAFLAAIVAIDLAALRGGRSTISRWCRYSVRRRPVMASVVAALLGLHLVLESPGDPLGWAARNFGKRIALES